MHANKQLVNSEDWSIKCHCIKYQPHLMKVCTNSRLRQIKTKTRGIDTHKKNNFGVYMLRDR